MMQLRSSCVCSKFSWKISEFNKLNKEQGKYVASKVFHLLGHEFRLRFYPGGTSAGTISPMMVLHNKSMSELSLYWYVTLSSHDSDYDDLDTDDEEFTSVGPKGTVSNCE
jgi:hypothetical protein